jgi:DDE superfamily endonuclease
VISYRAMPGVPEELVRYLARLLAAERRYRGTPARSRKLGCRAQAVMALRWFRDRTRIEALGRDHGVSRATAYRYVGEAVDVLSAQAPGLADALERALGDGVPYVILDGKVAATDRCTEKVTSVKGKLIDAWYSGKAHRHGGNVQAVMRPDGLPLWTGPAEPGSTADLPAARRHALPALYSAAARGMPVLADSGYLGAGIGILVPFKGPAIRHDPGISARTRDGLLRELRCRGERGFALLTQRWAVLQHVTASPTRFLHTAAPRVRGRARRRPLCGTAETDDRRGSPPLAPSTASVRTSVPEFKKRFHSERMRPTPTATA